MNLVFTNGCFDVLHAGHVRMLETAKKLGDWLVVGVNDDASVTLLKGQGRPVNTAVRRAAVLRALKWVDDVVIFNGVTAVTFIQRMMTMAPGTIKSRTWVKGGDYTLDSLNKDEVRIVKEGCGQIKVIPVDFVTSTTATLKALNAKPADLGKAPDGHIVGYRLESWNSITWECTDPRHQFMNKEEWNELKPKVIAQWSHPWRCLASYVESSGDRTSFVQCQS